MYRSICKLFSAKKRSKVSLDKSKSKFPINEPGETERNSSPSLSLVKITNNNVSMPNHKNEKIVTRTSVDVHQCPTQQLSENHNEGDSSDRHHQLNDKNIFKSNQIFFKDRTTTVDDENIFDDEPETPAPDNELHKFILDDVAEFYQQFSNLQTDVRILISKNVIIYVLGTNHANIQCKEDVVEIIKKVRPKTVLVELCSLRACSCKKHRSNAFQSTPKFTFRYLRTIITQLGFLPAMIFFTDVFREHLVAENSLLHYGGEFIAAMATAQSLKNCRIVLADRPIEITVKRQASAMGNWRGLRVTLQVTMALMFKKRMKQLMLSANRLVFDDPKTYEVLVFERDLFLTYSIQEAAREYENLDSVCRVVAVIGQGHMQGIQTYWGKVPSEFIPFIMSPQTILDQ